MARLTATIADSQGNVGIGTLDVAVTGSTARPGPSNTGHNNNLSRTFGSTTITQSWLDANNGGSRVLTDIAFTGQVSVEVDDLTIRNFAIVGGTYGIYNGVFTGQPTSGLVLEDGEVTRQASAGLLVSNTAARRLHIHDQDVDAIKPFSNVTVEACYIHRIGSVVGSHADGVQMVGGSNNVFRGNNFDMPHDEPGYNNSICLIIQTNNGPVDNITIDGNWINGGGYSVNIKDKGNGHGCPSNVTVSNNRFGRDYQFGLFTTGGCSVAMTGNVFDDTGEPV